MKKSLRILVLADTHNRLPPKLDELVRNVDEIWHLGDVCAPAILSSIEEFGLPVLVVHGNCDNNPSWPLVLNLERNGVRFRLAHIPPPRALEGTDVLLHGHTHVPRNERVQGVLFLNPGCVTRPNRGAPPSAAHLTISLEGEIGWHLLPLR